MLILVSGAKMQLPLELGVTDRQTDTIYGQTDRLNDYCNPLRMPLRVNYTTLSSPCGLK